MSPSKKYDDSDDLNNWKTTAKTINIPTVIYFQKGSSDIIRLQILVESRIAVTYDHFCFITSYR